MRRSAIKSMFLLSSGIALAQSGGTFTVTGAMTTPRYGYTATLLNNGKVLIAGGESDFNLVGAGQYGFLAPQSVLATAELYDPVSGTFARTGDMTVPRSWHTATLLPDGRVLIAGGNSTPPPVIAGGNSTPPPAIPPNTAEIYDPSTGTFAATGNMISGHVCQQAKLLFDGRVLIVGGSGASAAHAELYDPARGTFASAGADASVTSGGNTCQGSVSTVLSDGKVLIVWETASAEIFDPAAGSFTATANLSSPQVFPPYGIDFNDGLPTATLLLNGKVLLAGGGNDSGIHANAELYDPSTGAFTAAGAMTTGRDGQTATLLPDGTVLMAGGYLYGPGDVTLASTELYDPTRDAFTPSGNMSTPRGGGQTATLLADGRVLIAGSPNSSIAELYNPRALAPPPALFSLSGDGQGQGAIWDATTGLVPSPVMPAVAGEILSMYTSGLSEGSVIPPQVSIGGSLAQILYFGDAPGWPGFFQVNFRVPNGIAPGSAVPVRLSYLGRSSNEVSISVQ